MLVLLYHTILQQNKGHRWEITLVASKSQQWLAFLLKKMTLGFETSFNFRKGEFFITTQKKKKTFFSFFNDSEKIFRTIDIANI